MLPIYENYHISLKAYLISSNSSSPQNMVVQLGSYIIATGIAFLWGISEINMIKNLDIRRQKYSVIREGSKNFIWDFPLKVIHLCIPQPNTEYSQDTRREDSLAYK